jgi:molybdopterin-guanine dinucleotide biosynthesis protein A
MPLDLTGFVLAGGKSTRMGRDKAVLSLNGRTLLETALAAARSAAREVFILGPSRLYGGYGPTIADIFPGCGPLGGIHAALKHATTELNLVIAVDTPFLSSPLLAYLGERARASGAMVTAPEINGYPQPLCAIYSRDFLPIAEQALGEGNYKIVPLFPRGRTTLIGESELLPFAFTAEMFENLNTPEDLERARRRVPDGKP